MVKCSIHHFFLGKSDYPANEKDVEGSRYHKDDDPQVGEGLR